MLKQKHTLVTVKIDNRILEMIELIARLTHKSIATIINEILEEGVKNYDIKNNE